MRVKVIKPKQITLICLIVIIFALLYYVNKQSSEEECEED
jgi:hypothetical protein